MKNSDKKRVRVLVIFILFVLVYNAFAEEKKISKAAVFFTPNMDNSLHSATPNRGKRALKKNGFEKSNAVVGVAQEWFLREHPYNQFDNGNVTINKGTQAFLDQLKSSYDSIENSGSVLVHVNDHGGVVDNDGEFPEIVGYTTYNGGKKEEISMGTILTEVKKFEGSKRMKFIGTHCGGGSVHHLSHNLPNACSISPVNERRLYSLVNSKDLFSDGLYEELASEKKEFDLDGDKKTSLLEGWMAGMNRYVAHGHSSDTSGLPSSFALARKILGSSDHMGGYRSSRKIQEDFPDEYRRLNLDIFDLDCHTETGLDSLHSKMLFKIKDDYIPVMDKLKDDNFKQAIAQFPSETQKYLIKVRSDSVALITRLKEKNQKEIDAIKREYDRLQDKAKPLMAERQRLSDEVDKLIEEYNDKLAPEDLKFRKLKRERKLTDEEEKEYKKIRERMSEIRTEKNELENKHNGLGNDLRDEFSKLDDKAESIYGEMGVAFKMLQMMDQMTIFMSRATRAQKGKFLSLLSCEMEPL